MTGAARAAILARVRAALTDVDPAAPASEAPVERRYRRSPNLTPADTVALFAERASEYRATVRIASADELAGRIEACLDDRGSETVVVPADLPSEWRPAVSGLVEDDLLSAAQLNRIDAVVTGCFVAIAETGTVVLDGGAAQGRRAITLVPDHHVCVVRASQIVEIVPQAIAATREVARPMTLISGPSATSDIELSRVEGVHGPRKLDLLVVTDR